MEIKNKFLSKIWQAVKCSIKWILIQYVVLFCLCRIFMMFLHLWTGFNDFKEREILYSLHLYGKGIDNWLSGFWDTIPVYTILFSIWHTFFCKKDQQWTIIIPWMLFIGLDYLFVDSHYEWYFGLYSIGGYVLARWLSPLFGALIHGIIMMYRKIRNALRKKIAIDFGSYNTIIADKDGKTILDELSTVYCSIDRDPQVFGTMATLTHGRRLDYSEPLLDLSGINVDYASKMLSFFVKQAAGRVLGIFRLKPKVVFALPLSEDASILRALALSVRANSVTFIDQPIAAAKGIGLDVLSKESKMIVDIGHKTTDIAVISEGKIICSSSIPYAGWMFDKDISNYLKVNCDLLISENVARIKYEVGSAIIDLLPEEAPEAFYVQGSNFSRTGSKAMEIPYTLVASSLDDSLTKIEEAIQVVLKQTPSTLVEDIKRNGIWLVGGSSQLRGIDRRFTNNLGITCSVADNPKTAIARGAAMCLQDK